MDLVPATALFTRGLMLRTRAPDAAWARLGLGIMVFAMLMSQTLPGENRFQPAPGLHLLTMLAETAAWTMTVFALALFAPVITEEKEAGTLGLLRLAGLDALGLLLATSTTRLLEAALLLALTLPMMMSAITLGGVTLVQVLAVYMVLATWLVLLAQLGLFWSVVAATTPRAVMATLLTLALVPFVLLIAWWLTGSGTGPLEGPLEWLIGSSIIGRLHEVVGVGYAGGVLGRADAAHLLLALLFFVLAWIRCRRYQGEEDAPRELVGLLPVPGWCRRQPRHYRPPPGVAAITWKDRRQMLGGPWWIGLRVLSAAGWMLVLYVREGGHILNRCLGQDIIIIAAADLAFGIGIPLIVSFGEEMRLRALDGLLTLPMTGGTLFYAKWRIWWPSPADYPKTHPGQTRVI